MSNSVEKLESVLSKIDNNWLNLKKIIDKQPKKSIRFYYDKDGWQLEIIATSL